MEIWNVCGPRCVLCTLWRSRLLSLSLRLSQAEASKGPAVLFTSPSSLKNSPSQTLQAIS